MATYNARNIQDSIHFHLERVLLGMGLIVLLGLTGWVPSPISAPEGWAPVPLQEAREAPFAYLDPGEPRLFQTAPRSIFRLPITVTGYSSTVDQTDDSPFTTAWNTPVRPGILALSRDLLREFTRGAPFSYGDIVELEGVGVFTIEDTMNPRYTKRADIWFGTREAAQRWGRRSIQLAQLTPLAQASTFLAQSEAPLFEPALVD